MASYKVAKILVLYQLQPFFNWPRNLWQSTLLSTFIIASNHVGECVLQDTDREHLTTPTNLYNGSSETLLQLYTPKQEFLIKHCLVSCF